MDTRASFFLLLDYKIYYGEEKSLDQVVSLINGIPSLTLINYLSGFNVNLYLHDNDDDTGKIQFQLVNSLLCKCDDRVQAHWVEVVRREGNNGFKPIMFYNYSNLIFYNIVFKNFNDLPCRDLTSEEARRFFDAYLIINSEVNNKYDIDYSKCKEEIRSGHIENVTITNFIYQRDYTSTLDFSNQIIRGIEFFKYLENDPIYGPYIPDYYKNKNVNGYLDMLRSLGALICYIGIPNERRCQLAILENEINANIVNEEYLESLSINKKIGNYVEDISFKNLRERPLYRFDRYRFFILDINFLFDQFYKAQVFSFNSFVKLRGGLDNFLSDKGKHFTEEKYMPKIIDKCFPNYVRFYGDSCKDSNNEELCDAYIREKNRICIIECKDVILNAGIKNSGDKAKLFEEFDKKFVKNEKGKQKGITQLYNAIIDIDSHSVSFDSFIDSDIELYPVVLYTDNSFGIDGLNKYYRELFEHRLNGVKLKISVKPIIFINLNYFEMHCEYFANNRLDIWNLIDEYNRYIEKPNYELTPFEIYSRWYMNKYVPEDFNSNLLSQALALIFCLKNSSH